MAGYGNIANLVHNGRPKGVKNKFKPMSAEDLLECFAKHDFNPVIDNIMMAKDPDCPYMVRARINELFINKLYPTLKATEHSGSVESKSLSIQWNVDSGTQSPDSQPHSGPNSAITHEQTLDMTLETTLDTAVKEE